MTRMSSKRGFLRGRVLVLAAFAAFTLAIPATASAANDTSEFDVTAGSLNLETAPTVPNFGTLLLNGSAQTLTGQMADWQVNDATGSGAGWNVTVQGDSTAGQSAVFKEYCTDGTATNGCDTAVGGAPGPGYVTTSPRTLAANSLSLGSTGATFSAINGTTGTAPTHACGAICNVDSASAIKVASAAADAGMGTYQANTFAADSLSLSAPTTVYQIGTGNKVYRLDLVTTLNSGP